MVHNETYTGSEGQEQLGRCQRSMRPAVGAILAACSFILFWIHHILCPFPELDWDSGYMLHSARKLAEGKGYVTFAVFFDNTSPEDMAQPEYHWNISWPPLKAVVIAGLYRILGHFSSSVLLWYLMCGAISWLVFGYLIGHLVSQKWLALTLAIVVPPYVSHVYANFQSSEMMALPLFMLWALAGWHLLRKEPKTGEFLLWSVLGAVVAGLAVWAKFSMLFMLPAHAILLLLRMCQRRSIGWVAGATSAVLMSTIVASLFALTAWGDRITHKTTQHEGRSFRQTIPRLDLTKAIDHRPVTCLALGPAGVTFLGKNVLHRASQLAESDLSGWITLLFVPALAVLGLFGRVWSTRRNNEAVSQMVALAWIAAGAVTVFIMAILVRGGWTFFRERYFFYVYLLLLLSFFAVWPTRHRARDLVVKGCLWCMLISMAILAVRAHAYGVRNIVRHRLHVCEHVPPPYRAVIDRIEKTVCEAGHPAIVFSDVGGAMLAGTDLPVYRYPADNPSTSKQLHVFLVDFNRPGYESIWWEAPRIQRLRQRVDGEIIWDEDWGVLWHGIMDPDPGSHVVRENLRKE